MKILTIIILAFTYVALAAQEESITITGIVATGDGTPVEDVTVVLIPTDKDFLRAAGTGADGSFEIRDVPSVELTIWAAKDGYSLYQNTVAISDISTSQIRIELIPAQGTKLWNISLADRDSFRLATKLLSEYESRKALGLFLSFLDKYPYLIRAHYNVGLCYAELAAEARDYDQREKVAHLEGMARKHFDIVLERYPDYSAALVAKGESLVRTLNMQEAAGIYSELLQTIKNDPLIWYTYAEILSYIDRFDEAVVAYEEALKVNPEFIDAHAKIGAIRMSDGEYEEAIRQFELFLSKARRSNMTEETRQLLQQCRAKLHEQQKSKLREQ